MPNEFFKWQGAYGAFTVRKEDVPRVKEYIANQKKHHAENSLWAEMEKTEISETWELEEIEYAEKEVLG